MLPAQPAIPDPHRICLVSHQCRWALRIAICSPEGTASDALVWCWVWGILGVAGSYVICVASPRSFFSPGLKQSTVLGRLFFLVVRWRLCARLSAVVEGSGFAFWVC
jgi:hypothetical protein